MSKKCGELTPKTKGLNRMNQSKMILRYNRPAPVLGEFARHSGTVNYGAGAKRYENANSWERYSLPLGNGFFGANVFGRLGTERIQISEPTLSNLQYYKRKHTERIGCNACGINSFAELMLDFGHEGAADYEMSLSLEDAVCRVEYTFGGVRYKRSIFTSHPDRVMVIRLEADRRGAVSVRVAPEIPFLGDFTLEEGDGMAKRGEVRAEGGDISLGGVLEYYDELYEGLFRVIPDGGECVCDGSAIAVSGADAVTVIFSCATSYRLDGQIFSCDEPKDKLRGFPSPKADVVSAVDAAEALGYERLLSRHVADYRALFERVSLNIGDETEQAYTDELLEAYRAGKESKYLETLLFQYGRYLLIASSRTNMPAHLQGIWNSYCDSPWSCGYWHNINVQMNYWLSGPAALSELFIPYINYAKAYMERARRYADEFMAKNYPEHRSPDGKNGWIIGTGCGAFKIDGFQTVTHSGPGTGAFTSLLFWDYYDYTGDVEFLREFGYPALYEMSLFFSKILVEHDGALLVKESASPENRHGGDHYHTVGCAFDQQMVYENYTRTVEAAEILGEEDDPLITTIRKQLPHLEPVLIGESGQIKEYREETVYGSIGDPRHRHVSHLVGLYPGTYINKTRPELIAGAEVTLTGRGDESTGWAAAHRLLLWARCGNGRKAHDLVSSLIRNNIMENLWDTHPPFQIDGNFGYTAGVCEMLLASHAGYVELLPALPELWHTGEFCGLVARGNFSVDCRWERGCVVHIRVKSNRGGRLRIKLPESYAPKKYKSVNGFVELDLAKGEQISL